MSDVRRFACTLCGKCCNRSPEVELSEAATLADVFVFRLMFRLYSLPRAPDRGSDAEIFYQKKRLLAAHAARKYVRKAMRGGKPVEHSFYLMISALALDTTPGTCAALEEGRCSIHERRPLACRTVPFHYSRADGLALPDFDAFVGTPAYACDTSEAAPIVFEGGRIVHSATLQARSDALAIATRDRPWKEAIVRAMKTGQRESLPSLQDVEANAGFAAMTTSMRIGWQVAVEAGLLDAGTCSALVQKQLAIIDRELAAGGGDAETLREMRAEYRQARSPA